MSSTPYPLYLRLKLVLSITVAVLLANISWAKSASGESLSVPSLKTSLLSTQTSQISSVESLQLGKELYTQGKFSESIKVWQELLKNSDHKLQQAMLWSNISLAYQKLGNWTEAETALKNSLELLNTQAESKDKFQILGQALNTQGSLQMALGRTETALNAWGEAVKTFHKIGDTNNEVLTLFNQVQALRALGLYRRAITTLEEIEQIFHNQADSELKASTLRSLGDTLQSTGDFETANRILNQSLDIATKLNAQLEISATKLSLGNLARSQDDVDLALKLYREAASIAPSPLIQLQSQLNQLSLLIAEKRFAEARTLIPQIDTKSTLLTTSRDELYARLNYAQSLSDLARFDSNTSKVLQLKAAQILADIIQQAESLDDTRIKSYALGSLGALYEQTQQVQTAQELTQQALAIAESIKAKDIIYRWQWQLGRLRKAQGDITEAIAHYDEAVSNLKQLRGDLVAINPSVQFSFRESVEPVYKQLVSLLLMDRDQTDQKKLAKAQDVIESFQLSELVNFFRSDCLQPNSIKKIDEIDTQAALIYPIVLEDRIEVILSLPRQDKPLRHYSTKISQQEVEQIIGELQVDLREPRNQDYLANSQKVYDWLIRPSLNDLQKHNVKTLVFVLNGSLRNIPMSALHDGKDFLIQSYDIALTPGLQLLNLKPRTFEQITVLAGGLTQSRQGYRALPNVKRELQSIPDFVSTREKLVDERFTPVNLKQNLPNTSQTVIHLATHGQFSSKAAETFLLTWDGLLNVNSFNQIIQTNSPEKFISLLILSACETAVGDDRAALGLAGISVKSGVSSTIASLWSIDDEATASLMADLYKALVVSKMPKGEALRQAQVQLITQSKYKHPYYWAPFVLVGNWL